MRALEKINTLNTLKLLTYEVTKNKSYHYVRSQNSKHLYTIVFHTLPNTWYLNKGLYFTFQHWIPYIMMLSVIAPTSPSLNRISGASEVWRRNHITGQSRTWTYAI